jgi:hypothetical protein
MPGEGTRALVSRSTAEFNACLSCTSLFHHGDTETRRKTNEGKLKSRMSRSLAAAPRTTDDNRPTTASHHARCLLLQLLCLEVGDEGVDQRLKLAIHHLL